MIPELAALLNPIDIAAFAVSLPSKIAKDELRVRLFTVAIVNKTTEISGAALANALKPETPVTIVVDGQPAVADKAHVEGFAQDAQAILGGYVADAESAAKVSMHNFLGIFGHSDPFAKDRDAVRAFARRWTLDPAFVEAMG